MPEGHKTHFIARQHHRQLAGEQVKVTSPQGRFQSDARRINGREIESVQAVGKHLFYQFDEKRILHIHLGRYGKFREHALPSPDPVGQVRVRLVSSSSCIDLTGPTTCRVIDACQRVEVEQRLGPDPLAGGRRQEVWKRISSSSKPIAALLLDQAVVAGVGNIFRAEVLFEVGIDPLTPGDQLSEESFGQLWRSLTRMMRTGLKLGKIVTVTAKEAGMPRTKIEGNARFRVYGHHECPWCGGEIEAVEIAARRLYFCRGCQTAS